MTAPLYLGICRLSVAEITFVVGHCSTGSALRTKI
jgi:hypothetical protein